MSPSFSSPISKSDTGLFRSCLCPAQEGASARGPNTFASIAAPLPPPPALSPVLFADAHALCRQP